MSEGALKIPGAADAAGRLLLRAEAVDKKFYDGGREISVLRGLELEVAAGEEIAIVGQSGVGKSTLLHVLGSLEAPTAGRVMFEDRDLFAMDERALAEFRNRNLGFVFQFHYLLADFSALENVMMPGLIARLPDWEARQRAGQMLELVGLKDKFHRRPSELSGGEQQRVAVARAVGMSPRLVLADEPTGNLDPQTADEVHRLFHRLNSELGVTFMVATHNERLSRSMGRTLRLRDGRLFDETAA
jgi:lipoprotein-releasing system ATP-binding protein